MYERNTLNILNTRLSEKIFEPVLMEGVRGCGKSTLAALFAKRFAQAMTFDCTEPHDRKALEELNTGKLHFSDLYRYRSRDPEGGRTLLFINHVNASPETWENLIRLPHRPSNLFILGATNQTNSGNPALPTGPRHPASGIRYPVSGIRHPVSGIRHPVSGILSLLPLSFSEFLSATGETDALAAWSEVPCPDHAHEKLLNLFHRWIVTGGMPEAVRAWAEEHSIHRVEKIFGQIMAGWEQEILEQFPGKKSAGLAAAILSDAFPFAAARISFAGFANRNIRSREASEAFRRLEDTMFLKLVYPVTGTSPKDLPDTGRSPRLQFADTGMVIHFSGIRQAVSESRDLTGLFGGQVVRHAAGQELLSHSEYRLPAGKAGISNNETPLNLQFWVRDKNQSQAEVDLTIPFNGLLIPVAVRPGEPGRLRSLHSFLDAAPHPFAVRLCADRLHVRKATTLSGKPFYLMSLPYYLSGRIPEHLEGFIRYVGG